MWILRLPNNSASLSYSASIHPTASRDSPVDVYEQHVFHLHHLFLDVHPQYFLSYSPPFETSVVISSQKQHYGCVFLICDVFVDTSDKITNNNLTVTIKFLQPVAGHMMSVWMILDTAWYVRDDDETNGALDWVPTQL